MQVPMGAYTRVFQGQVQVSGGGNDCKVNTYRQNVTLASPVSATVAILGSGTMGFVMAALGDELFEEIHPKTSPAVGVWVEMSTATG